MATRDSVATVVRQGLGGRLFVALWGGLALVLVSRAVGLTSWESTAAVILLVGACSLGQGAAAAIAIAVTGWLVVDGFVQHRYGVLGFDTHLFLVLLAAIGLALTISTVTRKADR